MRALPDDFKTWPGTDRHGWGSEAIVANYRKHERILISGDQANYGKSGEISLNELNEKNQIKELIYEGAGQMGYIRGKPGDRLGYQDVLGTIENGMRLNYAKAFLKPIKDRPNLAVARGAYVTKITTQFSRDRRIDGVQVQIGGKEITVKAKKEVILTTGAINTAKLLMLSGFGPKNELKKIDVPLLVDLPVGQNLQDQVSTLIFVGIDKGAKSAGKDPDTAEGAYSYVMHRKGEFTQTNVNDLIGLINTEDAEATAPNLIIYHYFFDANDPNLETFLHGHRFHDAIKRSLRKQNRDERLVLFMPTLIKPKSRGRLVLESNHPFKQPVITGNYLSDGDDRQTLLSGVKYVLSLIETEPFVKRDAHFLEVDMPSCRNYKYCNVPYLECVVKTMSIPRSETIGTAQMGELKSSCDCRVTDEFLLIDGIRHLRIVDGSVVREHLTGNLDGTVGMMAENAAEQIKKCWINKDGVKING